MSLKKSSSMFISSSLKRFLKGSERDSKSGNCQDFSFDILPFLPLIRNYQVSFNID